MSNAKTLPVNNVISLEELRRHVAQQIEEAFADTPRPDDDQIAEPGGDNRDVLRALRGREWHDLSLAVITDFHVDLLVLTPEAFRYYLPAFLLAILYHYQHTSTLPLSVMHCLTPPDPTFLQKYIEGGTDATKPSKIGEFLNRVLMFNSKEKNAIWTFLETYPRWCPKVRGEQRYLSRATEFWQMA